MAEPPGETGAVERLVDGRVIADGLRGERPATGLEATDLLLERSSSRWDAGTPARTPGPRCSNCSSCACGRWRRARIGAHDATADAGAVVLRVCPSLRVA